VHVAGLGTVGGNPWQAWVNESFQFDAIAALDPGSGATSLTVQ
jgi:hypothetical protein